MAKLTLDELRKIREEKRTALELRESTNKNVHVIVGMGTCGIAAGAKEAFTALIEEITEKGLTNVLVRQSGCMGFCASEPTVEVVMPEMPAVIYGKVDAAKAREIVSRHILGRELLDEKICDRPVIENVTNG